MERLPPLNAVRAFEAAARHLSVTGAATELHVTPGAVSRQVQALERFLGIALFKRGHREISLTRRGEEYYKTVSKSLLLLQGATSREKQAARKRPLKIRAYITFAVRWLIPRLSGFHATHPSLELLLTASLDEVDFSRDDLDGAIRLCAGGWPGVRAYRLVSNILAPVCSPALLRSGLPLKSPADLPRHTLLHSIARPDDWAHWLRANGAGEKLDAYAGQTYQSSELAYQAAIEGQGIAMAQLVLVEKDLAGKRLVRPLRKTLDMESFTYYLLTPADRPESPQLKQFREWLVDQCSHT
jgi:LysR family transcriptional regulator, glycine cleavage system transcriptional activator